MWAQVLEVDWFVNQIHLQFESINRMSHLHHKTSTDQTAHDCYSIKQRIIFIGCKMSLTAFCSLFCWKFFSRFLKMNSLFFSGQMWKDIEDFFYENGQTTQLQQTTTEMTAGSPTVSSTTHGDGHGQLLSQRTGTLDGCVDLELLLNDTLCQEPTQTFIQLSTSVQQGQQAQIPHHDIQHRRHPPPTYHQLCGSLDTMQQDVLHSQQVQTWGKGTLIQWNLFLNFVWGCFRDCVSSLIDWLIDRKLIDWLVDRLIVGSLRKIGGIHQSIKQTVTRKISIDSLVFFSQ